VAGTATDEVEEQQMTDEAWVLGATGRTGRAIADVLHRSGVPLVLVGRNEARLSGLAAELGGPRIVAGSLASTLSVVAASRPGVVVSTVGPFTTTAAHVASVCPPGTHYVDVANELSAVQTVLGLDRRAADAGQVMVTGAGFGVLATESVVLQLCDGQPRPTQVRVDAIPSMALEAGVVGEALAATIVEIIRFGGRSVRSGRLVTSASAADPLTLITPDGDVISTGSGANGELIAAWHASGADGVVAATTAAPSNALVRALLPAVTGLVRLPGMSALATRGLARVPLRAAERARPSSWGHARVQWPSGTVRDGWLRVGDAMEFTASVAAEVTCRLLHGEGRPGSYTPGALFGAELAEAAGGSFVLDQPRTTVGG